MDVTLTHADVLAACKEWLEKHYGIAATADPKIEGLLAHNQATYTFRTVTVTYVGVHPSPTTPYRDSDK